ncbi:MAG: amino acid permease, partial [Candidatus Gastranaerophilales bacterium]|nr:amino acid permease [Candidatus Gastranaerophilales bacterium]
MTIKENGFLKRVFRMKNPDELVAKANEHGLKKTLGAFDLVILGVGAVIGTGIFTVSGAAIAGSAQSGPSFMLALVLAGLACIFSAFCYAEFASMIPVAGSAYTYTFATFGQCAAWLMGWVLMLEYAIGNIAVAIALAGYWFEFLKWFDKYLPAFLTNKDIWIYNFTLFGKIPFLLNIPSILIIALITVLLYKGISESAKASAIMVVIKLAVIAVFVFAGLFHINPANWHPFMPHGWGVEGWSGLFQATFLIFFAYIGFDAVSTAAEETKNPQKDMPIGIIGTLLICILVYVIVGAVLTGLFPFDTLSNNAAFIDAPIAYALRMIGKGFLAMLVSVGAMAGLFSVLLVLQLGTTRVLFAMARDNLLPPVLAKIHPKFQTPHIITVVVGIFTILGTFFLDLEASANLCNIGTFMAFIVVSIGVIILRYTDPNRKRGFKIPLMPIIPILGIICCLLIIYKGIPLSTFIAFAVWVLLGLGFYFAYSYKN